MVNSKQKKNEWVNRLCDCDGWKSCTSSLARQRILSPTKVSYVFSRTYFTFVINGNLYLVVMLSVNFDRTKQILFHSKSNVTHVLERLLIREKKTNFWFLSQQYSSANMLCNAFLPFGKIRVRARSKNNDSSGTKRCFFYRRWAQQKTRMLPWVKNAWLIKVTNYQVFCE